MAPKSTNIVQIDARISHHIAALRDAIDGLQLSDEQKTSSHEVIDGVEEQFKSGAPKKSVVTALLSALPHAANIATIVSAIAGLF